jgi:hypothetical protein
LKTILLYTGKLIIQELLIQGTLYLFVRYYHIEFHMCSSTDSSVIITKQKTDNRFLMAGIVLFYILQTESLGKNLVTPTFLQMLQFTS